MSTAMNSWDVNLKVRVPFSKIIHKRALSEMFDDFRRQRVLIATVNWNSSPRGLIKGAQGVG
jgi:hypothetical protein